LSREKRCQRLVKGGKNLFDQSISSIDFNFLLPLRFSASSEKNSIFGFLSSGVAALVLRTGRPDWANFRPKGDCFYMYSFSKNY
jgi:hypothetical protein